MQLTFEFTSGSEEGYHHRKLQQNQEHAEWLGNIRRILGHPLREKVVGLSKTGWISLTWHSPDQIPCLPSWNDISRYGSAATALAFLISIS